MGKMKSYMMDLEEQFIQDVSDRIGECEMIEELLEKLVQDNCFDNVAHLSSAEQDEWVDELWNEFWMEYQRNV